MMTLSKMTMQAEENSSVKLRSRSSPEKQESSIIDVDGEMVFSQTVENGETISNKNGSSMLFGEEETLS